MTVIRGCPTVSAMFDSELTPTCAFGPVASCISLFQKLCRLRVSTVDAGDADAGTDAEFLPFPGQRQALDLRDEPRRQLFRLGQRATAQDQRELVATQPREL